MGSTIANNTVLCLASHWYINGAAIFADNNLLGMGIVLRSGVASGNKIRNGYISASNFASISEDPLPVPNAGALISITGNNLVDSSIHVWGGAEVSGNTIQVDTTKEAITLQKFAPNAVSNLNARIVGNFIAGGSIGIHLRASELNFYNETSHALICGNRIYQSRTPIQIEADWSNCLVTDNLVDGDIRDYGTENIIRGNSNDTGSGTGTQGPQGPAEQGVPTGGTAGQVLAKNSAVNYDTRWVDLPTGGGGSGVEYTAGDGITIQGSEISVTTPVKEITQAEYDALPQEQRNKALYIIIDADGGPTQVGSLPPGGTEGQVLSKASGEDYDSHWVDPPEGGSGGVGSFNGRTGIVSPEEGDYTAEMVGAATSESVLELNEALIALTDRVSALEGGGGTPSGGWTVTFKQGTPNAYSDRFNVTVGDGALVDGMVRKFTNEIAKVEAFA